MLLAVAQWTGSWPVWPIFHERGTNEQTYRETYRETDDGTDLSTSILEKLAKYAYRCTGTAAFAYLDSDAGVAGTGRLWC